MIKVGLVGATSLGWVSKTKTDQGLVLTRSAPADFEDTVSQWISKVNQDPSATFIPSKFLKSLIKRKAIKKVTIKDSAISRGPKYSESYIQYDNVQLTPNLIAEGWDKLNFKPYNFNARGVLPVRGALHPLMKMRTEFRQIFLEMGFQEMPTNRWVESSFWNFDALFQPQQHPARDAHDTFFLKQPASTLVLPDQPPADKSHAQSFVQRCKQMHSNGGAGSKGWRYDWKESEARKNIMRTHTTAVSARMLYQLAYDIKTNTKKVFTPKKYFSIDRVFRNETLDKTHLAEFHQIEGLVADRNLSLGDLQAVIRSFFEKVGIDKLKFKVAYNPYTEPSMEIFSWHEGLQKWVEIGNSGIFRPEMTIPLGLPEDVTVIAWGLGLERPTRIRSKLDNIRALFGPTVQTEFIAENPIVRFSED